MVPRSSTAVGEAAFLRLCYVMKRNGAPIDQCFPLTEACSTVPASQADR